MYMCMRFRRSFSEALFSISGAHQINETTSDTLQFYTHKLAHKKHPRTHIKQTAAPHTKKTFNTRHTTFESISQWKSIFQSFHVYFAMHTKCFNTYPFVISLYSGRYRLFGVCAGEALFLSGLQIMCFIAPDSVSTKGKAVFVPNELIVHHQFHRHFCVYVSVCEWSGAGSLIWIF